VSKIGTENSKARSKRADRLAEAVGALRRGDVIVFPTETLYGLGANALNGHAVEQVFQLKGRDPKNPIPVLVSDQNMLFSLITEIPTLARVLIDHFWPGPLTLVLPAREGIPAPLLNAKGGVGVRISNQPIAMQLMQAFRLPLTATSANPSGKEPARTVSEAKQYFAGKINVFVDGGILTSKTGSTVVEVIEDTIRIIREGEIRRSELKKMLRNRGMVG
jgi:L-threonylcarbamoyladenylate synthase